MWSFPKIFVYVILLMVGLAMVILATSCTPTRELGCSKRNAKKVARIFPKLVNLCNYETMRQIGIFYPFKESDSSSTEYKKGVATLFREAEVVPFDCDSFIAWRDSMLSEASKEQSVPPPTKAQVKCPPCPYTVDTINHYRELIKEDSRKLAMQKIEHEQELSDLKKKLQKAIEEKIKSDKAKAKSDGKLMVFYWGIGIVIGIVGIGFAVKNFKPKIPFFG